MPEGEEEAQRNGLKVTNSNLIASEAWADELAGTENGAVSEREKGVDLPDKVWEVLRVANITNPREKVKRILNSGQTPGITLNPFLKKDGSLVNPYINYQKVLDNPNVSTKAKEFISNATGLSPTPAVVRTSVVPTDFVNSEKSVSTQEADAATPNGFVKTETNVPSSGSGIADAAKGYIGTPYVWGGESMAEGGMDCSGFVYNALKDAGYNIGRTTAQGYRDYGNSVSKADMQPGDLVFYGKNDNASHIGIYIGNGQMIHSSGGSGNTKDNPGKGVSIANVDYRSDFIEARRY